MGTLLVEVVGLILVAGGIALIYVPAAVIFAGIATFAVGWALDNVFDIIDDMGDSPVALPEGE